MNAQKLDRKATVAGGFLLLNLVLWVVQIGVDYAIKDGGFWGVGGIVQNYTVVLSQPASVLYLLAMLVGGILLLTRRPMPAVVGLGVLALYYIYSLFGDGFGITVNTLAVLFLVAGIFLAAVAIFNPGASSNKLVRITAVVLIGGYWVINLAFNMTSGRFADNALLVNVLVITRGVLVVAGLIVAALAKPEAPAAGGAHWES